MWPMNWRRRLQRRNKDVSKRSLRYDKRDVLTRSDVESIKEREHCADGHLKGTGFVSENGRSHADMREP